MGMGGGHLLASGKLHHCPHEPEALGQHQAHQGVGPMDVAREDAQEHQQEGHEEEDGVCRQAGLIGAQHDGEGLLVRDGIDVALDEGMGVEDVGDEQADGATQGQDVPDEACRGAVERTAGRLIDATDEARAEADADDQFAKAVETELQGRCGIEIAEQGTEQGDAHYPPVELALPPDDGSAEQGNAYEHGYGSAQLGHRGGAVAQIGIFVREGLLALLAQFFAVAEQFVLPVEIVVEQIAAQVHHADTDYGQQA